MDLINAVRTAAEENGITGVMKLKEHCGLSYERTKRIWYGEPTSKLQDISLVMKSLGYQVCYKKIKQ